ncbi:MAG TPA: helix-turn-helix domain-containing protein [Saprospiraceae bacterium]|nr:helix-turn-helix domain-containing protein [Saprospiraceae bacterium]HMQ84855.1 helix-turn-helix domain-containing protein [Saprospiraceae bacterium]
MIYVVGTTIAAFLCLALLLKKKKGSAEYILAAWMLVAAFHQLLFYLTWSGQAMKHPHLLGLSLPLPVLYGVMLYFYTSEITEEKPFSWRVAGLHLLPFFCLIGLALPFYSLSAAEKKQVFENDGADYLWYQYILLSWFTIATIGYAFWALKLIRNTRRRAQHFFSNTEKRNLAWLEYLSFGLVAICLLVLFFDDTIIFSGVAFLMVFIGLHGINQTAIFQSDRLSESVTLPETTAAAENSRYLKSGLKEAEAEQLFLRLQELVHVEKPFKNPDLTLTELAKSLDVHPNYLSQVINEKAQRNFYNYINTRRVEEFLKLAALPGYKHYTLLALAFECGFNSKSTFNKYFKLHTGKTPSTFFQEINN